MIRGVELSTVGRSRISQYYAEYYAWIPAGKTTTVGCTRGQESRVASPKVRRNRRNPLCRRNELSVLNDLPALARTELTDNVNAESAVLKRLRDAITS